jgi:hypothetical protein
VIRREAMIESCEKVSISNQGIDVRDHEEEEEEDKEEVELVIDLCGRLWGGAVDVSCWFLACSEPGCAATGSGG